MAPKIQSKYRQVSLTMHIKNVVSAQIDIWVDAHDQQGPLVY